MIFNTFKDFYHQLAGFYYTDPENRKLARELWEKLKTSISKLNTTAAASQVTDFVASTAVFWKDITFEQYQKEVLEEPEKKKKSPEKKKKIKS